MRAFIVYQAEAEEVFVAGEAAVEHGTAYAAACPRFKGRTGTTGNIYNISYVRLIAHTTSFFDALN